MNRPLNGYDLQPYAVRTQAEVGARLGISRARVQQLEQAALRKMRAALDAIGGYR